jgi:hypothetical protein
MLKVSWYHKASAWNYDEGYEIGSSANIRIRYRKKILIFLSLEFENLNQSQALSPLQRFTLKAFNINTCFDTWKPFDSHKMNTEQEMKS